MAQRIISEETRKKRSESMKLARARLKADPVAFAKFQERIAASTKAVWQKDQTARLEKISATRKEQNAKLTQAERSEKYGWMNKPHVTPERKREVWDKSLNRFYKEASEETLAALYERRAKAIIKSSKAKKIFDNNQTLDHPSNKWAAKLFAKDDRLDELFGVIKCQQ